jgi:hypothetical protein
VVLALKRTIPTERPPHVGEVIAAWSAQGQIYHSVQTGFGAHPASYTYVMSVVKGDSSLGVKRSGREADHSPLSSLEVKNAWAISSLPLMSSCHSAQLINHRDILKNVQNDICLNIRRTSSKRIWQISYFLFDTRNELVIPVTRDACVSRHGENGNVLLNNNFRTRRIEFVTTIGQKVRRTLIAYFTLVRNGPHRKRKYRV